MSIDGSYKLFGHAVAKGHWLRYTVSSLIFMRILAVHFLATGTGYRDAVNAKTQSFTEL